MTKRKKPDWRQGYVPTPEGACLLRVDRNSETTAVSFDPKTGVAQATVGCSGSLTKPDGSAERVFVSIEVLEKLGLEERGKKCPDCGSHDTLWIPSTVATTEMRFCKACQHPYAADWYGRAALAADTNDTKGNGNGN